ncbi:hypothetical protein NQ315_012266 [Exocentrus adspersus]|uniref:Uncharacterized protein n=1 Tax=Exocentrus adspersus TaxID=1586481 RepID=A0AAV8VFB3_9CUCU|nr:hypothetical protein NQ315_012266 [Exocentrus adspersus]
MKFFIDGTCCLFKSSTLFKLQSEGVPMWNVAVLDRREEFLLIVNRGQRLSIALWILVLLCIKSAVSSIGNFTYF